MDIKIFKPKVEGILRASDLETVSAKRVRKQLMEDVGLDLRAYKNELDELIKSCFQSILPGSSTEDVKPVVKREISPELALPPPTSAPKRVKVKAEVKSEPVVDDDEEEDADVRYARELQAQYDSPRASRSAGARSTTKRKRPAVKKKKVVRTEINSDGEVVEVKKKVANNSFNKLLTLSDELAELLGTPYLSRPQVSKQIWAYIKAPERNLQDQTDKRYINCDEKLTSLLGISRVHMFSMTKILQKHMRDDGTAPIGYGAGEDIKTEAADLVDSDDDDDKKKVIPKIEKQESSSEESS